MVELSGRMSWWVAWCDLRGRRWAMGMNGSVPSRTCAHVHCRYERARGATLLEALAAQEPIARPTQPLQQEPAAQGGYAGLVLPVQVRPSERMLGGASQHLATWLRVTCNCIL